MSIAVFASSLADRLAAQPGPPKRLADYLHDPVGFAHELIDWADEGLTAYQAEILACLASDRRVAVRGPHGLGKTTVNAVAVLWFALTRDAAGVDWKCVTTAGAWRQLDKYLWPEIHKWARRVRWDRVAERGPFNERSELLMLSLTLGHGEAFAAASDNPALIEGAHADHVLYVFDESKSIIPDVFDAAEGAFSGATGGREAYALAQSTPGEPVGRFYEIHARRRGLDEWTARHVTLDEAVTAGRVSGDWAAKRAVQWGADSGLYANRVLGEFHSADEDGVIPLAWLEAANLRWEAWQERLAVNPEAEPHGRFVVACDVARFGADKTVIITRQGDVLLTVERFTRQDTMVTVGRVNGKLGEVPHALAVVDADGLGGPVVDRLREQGRSVLPFVAQAACKRRDRTGELGFVNTRSAAWWNLREMLDPAYGPTLAVPPDDELAGDLVSPKWRVTSGAKIAVESKDDIRPRLGRSPDAGDACVYACWAAADVASVSGDGYASWDLYAELAS